MPARRKDGSSSFGVDLMYTGIKSAPNDEEPIFICHVRLKRSGAWWKIDNANNVLKLRCAKYNAKFDNVFEMHETANQKQPQHSAVTRKRIK
jgi:hypothetical protein